MKLNDRSMTALAGVNFKLVQVVKTCADIITNYDFIVYEGLRTKQRQQELYDQGATRTLKSRHLDGRAVDMVIIKDNVAMWDLGYVLADFMRQASIIAEVPVEWGGCWHEPMHNYAEPTCLEASRRYAKDFKVQYPGKKPFIDFPHFQI